MGVDPWVDGDISPYFLKWTRRPVFYRLIFAVDIFCTNAHSMHWNIGAIIVKLSQLVLRKIIKIAATRCQILRLKMHQIQFRLGLHPRPCWGSLQRSPGYPSWI